MSKITISEAANQGYASRPTIYRHLKIGKITAIRTKDGRTVLDSIELRRVYGNPFRWSKGRVAMANLKKYEYEITKLNSETVRLQSEVKLLNETVKYLKETIKNYKSEIEDERLRVDKLLDIIDRA